MIRRKKGSYEWLEFTQLQPYPQVVHGVFTKKGNLCFTSQGSYQIAEKLLSLPKVVGTHLVHGKDIEDVPPQKPCDGMFTQKRGVGLLMSHADCQAAIFFDPVQEAIGAVHAGWRGSVQNIYKEMVAAFQKRGSRPEDLLVCISPSLGPTQAEFIHYQKELPATFLPFKDEHNHFDFWHISEMQLLEAGVQKEHIEVARICTYLNGEDFFSYRRDTKTGRNATIVALTRNEKVARSS